MSATFAPSPWPAPAMPSQAPAWQFGREVQVEVAGRRHAALQWVLQRNCSIAPRQLLAVYLSLCAVALLISVGFWWQGAPVVTAFASVELLLVGVALLAYARHAGDREVLTLAGRSLAVEQNHGNRVARADFQAEWLKVEPVAGQGSLVELSAHGQSIRVGRLLRPEARNAFAQELRRAVRRAGTQEQATGYELK